MNVCRKRIIFGGLLLLSGALVMFLCVGDVRLMGAMDLLALYTVTVRDIVLLGVFLPLITFWSMKEVNDWMSGCRLLSCGSRNRWWSGIKKILIEESLACSIAVILPVFIVKNIYAGRLETAGECLYMMCLLLSYFMYFFLAALCVLALEVWLGRGLPAVLCVFAISMFPKLAAFFFRQMSFSTIVEFLNMKYAVEDGIFYPHRCAGGCALLICLALAVERAGNMYMKKRDIYWK